MKNIAVTGHRPKKLFDFNPYSEDNYRILLDFARGIVESLQNRDVVVLTGMALGWDMAIAEACSDLEVPFKAYIPCKDQEKQWPVNMQAKYLALISLASEVKYFSEEYTSTCMRQRNIGLIKDCDRLLALWDGSRQSGTGHAVKFLMENYPEKEVVNLWMSFVLWKVKHHAV